MRRKPGVSAIKGRERESKQFHAVGRHMEETRLTAVKEVLSAFQTSLSEFALKYRDRINADPEFRDQFHKMCLSAGNVQ